MSHCTGGVTDTGRAIGHLRGEAWLAGVGASPRRVGVVGAGLASRLGIHVLVGTRGTVDAGGGACGVGEGACRAAHAAIAVRVEAQVAVGAHGVARAVGPRARRTGTASSGVADGEGAVATLFTHPVVTQVGEEARRTGLSSGCWDTTCSVHITVETRRTDRAASTARRVRVGHGVAVRSRVVQAGAAGVGIHVRSVRTSRTRGTLGRTNLRISTTRTTSTTQCASHVVEEARLTEVTLVGPGVEIGAEGTGGVAHAIAASRVRGEVVGTRVAGPAAGARGDGVVGTRGTHRGGAVEGVSTRSTLLTVLIERSAITTGPIAIHSDVDNNSARWASEDWCA